MCPASSTRTEFWAVGMRNPWRFSIDRFTGFIWVGDVGGSYREEVTSISKGGQLGWAFREGDIDGPNRDRLRELLQYRPDLHLRSQHGTPIPATRHWRLVYAFAEGQP